MEKTKGRREKRGLQWGSPFALFPFLFSLFLASACGYRVAGTGASLPPAIKTIAIPALKNETSRYRVEQRLTEALVREFIARTKYRIVPDPANADAVLSGEITGLDSSAVLFDTATGRATTMLVTVKLKVRLAEIGSKKVLWQNDEYIFREQYEISTDLRSFFEEQEPALERLAREFAASLVSAVLEKF